VPITWTELASIESGNQFTVLNLPKRLQSLKGDPWAEIRAVRQKLPK